MVYIGNGLEASCEIERCLESYSCNADAFKTVADCGELLQGADFSGNRPAKVSWVPRSERIRWQ
jgi:hypothetical protein